MISEVMCLLEIKTIKKKFVVNEEKPLFCKGYFCLIYPNASL